MVAATTAGLTPESGRTPMPGTPDPPYAGSVSWLRGYAMPAPVEAMRPVPENGKLGATDVRHVLADGLVVDGDYEFWDIQALRRRHVLRVISSGAVECRRSGREDWIPVRTHLLLHEAGLVLIRLTLDPFSGGRIDTIATLADYSDAVWRGERIEWRVRLGGGERQCCWTPTCATRWTR